MAETASNMLPLGTAMPDFTLPDLEGKAYSSTMTAGKPVLVVFMCNHCPFVINVIDTLASKARDYEKQGVRVIGINANDISTHPADSPDKMKVFAADHGIGFPYLYDETQKVAQAFKAACTPDFFLFDAGHKLVYRGQFDDSRPSLDKKVSGSDLNAAINALIAGDAIPELQKPSLGCNIKWKKGNEPGLNTLF